MGVVSERTSGKTSGQTNGRTDRRLQNVFCLKMFSCAFICSELALKPFPLYEDSIDTTYEQICQKMWE